jgi:SAM-dependent methyltransferase
MSVRPLEFFEGIEMPTAGWWEALWPDPAGVVAAVGLRPGMEVAVDLCCGNGWFTLPIAKIARRVVAIDIDPGMVEMARLRCSESGAENCDFVRGDAYEVKRLVPGRADFVFMANSFHGVPDRTRLAHVVASALKPGGRFVIVNWHRRPREETQILGEPRGPETRLRLSPEQTINSIDGADLSLAETIDLPPHHYAVLFQTRDSN